MLPMASQVTPKIQLTITDPSMTLLHRVGVGGLWMTLKRLEQEHSCPAARPGNLTWSLSNCSISLNWEGEDFKVLDWLLKQSFQINNEGLISLIGLNLQAQIIVHQGITATFLQHNKFFKSLGQAIKSVTVDDKELRIEYKKAVSYAHQDFAKHLCDKSGQLLSEMIGVVGWLYPGAVVRHSAYKQTKFEEQTKYALALLFAPVACHYFVLRSDLQSQMQQYALVIPDIRDLEYYAKQRWDLMNLGYEFFHASSLGDAGLKLIAYEKNSDRESLALIRRCQVIQFGTVAWSKRQKTRTRVLTIEANEKIINRYQLICNYFPDYEIVKFENKNFVMKSQLQGIIANNLATGLPWWKNLLEITETTDLLKDINFVNIVDINMTYNYERDMEAEKIFIKACHQALKQIYAKIYDRVKENEYARIEQENIRIISQLRRCTNARLFRKFIAEFWAKAGHVSILQEHWEKLLPLSTGMSDWQLAKDLTLIAIASYPKNDKQKAGSSVISEQKE
jgi:CRISPR-associated protein Cas8a1/Csx13